MRFLDRLLGIDRIKRRIWQLRTSTLVSWEWIRCLYRNQLRYGERIAKLEESNRRILNLLEKVMLKLDEISTAKPKEVAVEPMKLEMTRKDATLLRILHQYAAFDAESSISTNEIYKNLPFALTKRGLRKRLMNLQLLGLISSIRKGNVKYWHLSEGRIAKIKKVIREESS
jgi:predicted transcriptional regulator with HTH domain